MICLKYHANPGEPTMKLTTLPIMTIYSSFALMTTLLALTPHPVAAEQYRHTCSSWADGRHLGDFPCTAYWANGRVYKIIHLSKESEMDPGRPSIFEIENTRNAYTQKGNIPGRLPECIVYKANNYAICQKR
jgi:hypothetical protein